MKVSRLGLETYCKKSKCGILNKGLIGKRASALFLRPQDMKSDKIRNARQLFTGRCIATTIPAVPNRCDLSCTSCIAAEACLVQICPDLFQQSRLRPDC